MTEATPIAISSDSSIRSGDLDKRYEALMLANGAALRRLAASYTRTEGDRDDLFQEIAIAIWKALPSFRGESSERTFLFRIAHNCGIDQITRKKIVAQPLDGDLDPPDTRRNPEEQTVDDQRRASLYRAIRALPLPYRQVTTLALEDMDYGQISEILGIEISNVGARLTRARKLLRDLLEAKR